MRLNADGSIDNSFASSFVTQSHLFSDVTDVQVSSDGKIYAAYYSFNGAGVSGSVLRFNATGGADPAWDIPLMIPPSSVPMSINGLTVAADGSVVVAGHFSSVNGVPASGVVRLLSGGNVDLTFSSTLSYAGSVRSLQDGKYLVSGTLTGSNYPQKIFRLNADGSADGTYSPAGSIHHLSLGHISIGQSDQSLIFAEQTSPVPYQITKFFRLNANGSEDATFAPNIGNYGTVHTIANASNGKLVVGGEFNSINGIAGRTVARINSNGSVDTTFNAGIGFSRVPSQVVVQSDDKVIAVGNFEKFGGTIEQPWIARLNADGSFDSGFRPEVTQVRTVGIQSDGKIIIAGDFSAVNGTARTRLARLNPDGSLDSSFNVIVNGDYITKVFVQSDNSIIVLGSFSGVGGFNRTNAARLLADGAVDPTFNVSAGVTVHNIWRQADGKYIVSETTGLKRLNSDGTVDPGFTPSTYAIPSGTAPLEINAVEFASDGSIIVGGSFDRVNGLTRLNLVRLNSAGELIGTAFTNGADKAVKAIVRAGVNEMILRGAFSRIDPFLRVGLAKVVVSPTNNSTPFDFDGDGRADITVFRPGTGAWYSFYGGSPFTVSVFGMNGDVTAPADYDGDAKADKAIFRPSTGTWWYQGSLSGNTSAIHLGTAADKPLASDFDGDGKDDLIVYRSSNNTWYRLGSTGIQSHVVFGQAGDIPLVANMDGDGKSDPTVFRPSTGTWWYSASSQGGAFRAANWGMSGDIPVPADYDGDGKTDMAVYRPTSGVWYVVNSSNQTYNFQAFGLSGDIPVTADYDGDGKADIAVFRPSAQVWYILQSTAGFAAVQWGLNTDVPVQASYLP